MAINDATYQLRDLIRPTTLPLIEVADLPEQLPQMTAGQRVQAQVVALLQNGRFQTQIAGTTVELNLPKSTQVGDQVDLTFVSGEPRATFQFNGILQPAATRPTQVNLSASGQLLAQLNVKSNASGPGPSQSTLVHTTPVISGPPQDRHQLAEALRSTLGESGFFYESHQAEWVTGQRPLAQLLKEPQARPGEKLVSTLNLPTKAETVAKQPATVQNALAVQISRPSLGIPVKSDVPTIQQLKSDVPIDQQQRGSESGLITAAEVAPELTVSANVGPNVPKFDVQSDSVLDSKPGVPGPGVEIKSNKPGDDRTMQSSLPEAHKSLAVKAELYIPAKSEGESNRTVAAATIGSPMQSASTDIDTSTPAPQQIMHQQIQMLDSHQVVWQGQVWPGQAMQWTIGEEVEGDDDGDAQSEQEGKPWHTSVNMQMPELGSVSARLSLTGKNVRLQIDAVDSATAEKMKGRLQQLENAYASAGLKLQQVAVKHEPKT